jgi:hypothetical protein
MDLGTSQHSDGGDIEEGLNSESHTGARPGMITGCDGAIDRIRLG